MKIPRSAGGYEGRGRVLRVKEGFNPNSSSLGSVVFSLHTALVAAPAVLAGVAAWLASRVASERPRRSGPPGSPGGEDES